MRNDRLLNCFRGVMNMELRVLKYFLAVARQENISRAAENW